MTLHQIQPNDYRHQVVAPLTVAELKALYNALAVDVASGGGTSPGVDLDGLLAKVEAILKHSEPPTA
jgi:hypothetical protein